MDCCLQLRLYQTPLYFAVNLVVFHKEVVMQLRMASVTFLIASGIWHTGALIAAPAEPQSEAPAMSAAGIKYEHRLEMSRFDVGKGVHHEIQGPFERVLGDKGIFFIDKVTGAMLAVHNAPVLAKPSAVATMAGDNPPQPLPLPKPLTENSDEHSAVVRAYLFAAGVPEAEVSGTHVTTTIAGGGPVHGGMQPSLSKLLWYTTHLERSLGGIPVEGSYAFAALDSAGDVITEGVYWPAIPAKVIYRAQVLQERMESANGHAAFLADVRKAQPDMGDDAGTVGDTAGTVKIVHTSAGHHGKFEAHAVYSVVMPNAIGGMAQILRFDDTGARVQMPDELVSGMNSAKHK
jgi:hypothetical protein